MCQDVVFLMGEPPSAHDPPSFLHATLTEMGKVGLAAGFVDQEGRTADSSLKSATTCATARSVARPVVDAVAMDASWARRGRFTTRQNASRTALFGASGTIDAIVDQIIQC